MNARKTFSAVKMSFISLSLILIIGLTSMSRPNKITDNPANEVDSLALVALYDSCNGVNWKKQENWLTTNVSEWQGIELNTAGRVVEIKLINNLLTGALPLELDTLIELEEIRLHGNELTGPLPHWFSEFTKLSWLELSRNQFTGTIPESWAAMNVLEQLIINDNLLSGSLPEWLPTFSNLLNIRLDDNQYEGAIPRNWINFEKLAGLSLAGNMLGDTLPDWIYQMQLYSLNLSDNNYVGEIPIEWSNNTQIQQLYLDNNELEGELPAWISELRDLDDLGLDGNNFTGQLPLSWASLTDLQGLSLSNNQLSGELPENYSTLINLNYLYLERNQFTGEIPDSWQSMTKINAIYLFNNQLSGPVPTWLINFEDLNSLLIDNNNFTGFPDLSSLSNIYSLSIRNNLLEFDDIEPNIEVPQYNFSYAPQKTIIGTATDTTLDVGTPYSIDIEIGGQANIYQWQKNGEAIVGENSSSFSISELQLSDAGIYNCSISNPITPDLTIVSQDVSLSVISNVEELSTTDIYAQAIRIFPNPLTDQSTIIVKSSKKDDSIEILDSFGRCVKTIMRQHYGGDQIILDSGSFKPGIYYLKLNSDRKSFYKFIVL